MKIDRSLLPVIANAEDDDVFCFTFFRTEIDKPEQELWRACVRVCDEIVEV